MPYYGPGPDSQETGRSQYRLDDTSIDATLAWRITPHWILGAAGGHVWVNTGPGNDDRFAQAQEQYASVPGMQQQSNFGRGSVFLGFDWRDSLTGPRKGGIYGAELSNFWDLKLNQHDFSRLTLEAQQYVPVLNKRRVFAFRGRTVLTSAKSGKSVPFYLQPTLGGSDDLRGYRPFRFYGNNLFNLNAEYRWEIFSGLDMAVFWDGGKVFNRRGEFGLRGMESAVGFGFRANARNATFLRIDVGFSHEGFQVWFKFNDVFSRRLTGSSSTQTVI
jgi:outer membrane protein assembly factor BamA